MWQGVRKSQKFPFSGALNELKYSVQLHIFCFFQVKFNVTLEVKNCPPKGQEEKTLRIKPVGLYDTLTVKLKLKCQCDCESSKNMVSGNQILINIFSFLEGVGKTYICQNSLTVYLKFQFSYDEFKEVVDSLNVVPNPRNSFMGVIFLL